VNVLQQHLIELLPPSDVRDKHQIQPMLIYNWRKTFIEK
jgi:hypothetical protein